MKPRSFALLCALLAVSLGAPASVLGQRRPVLERVSPTSGPPGTEVQLICRHLAQDARIFLGEAELAVSRRLPNRWTATIPEGAGSGRIEVQTPTGFVPGPEFTVTQAPDAPVLEAMEPQSGAPGTTVTLRGQHFSPRLTDNQVRIGDHRVVLRRASPTALVITVPRGATTGPVTLVVAGAGEATGGTFTVEAGTAVTEFSPTAGPPGTRVTVRGTGFSTNRRHNRVFLNDRSVSVIRATSTELTVQIPRGAASGKLLVDVRGAGRAETADPFVIRYAPTLSGVSPRSGPPGHLVTLRGTHFGVDPRVVIVTLAERQVRLRRVTDHLMEVELPADAQSGTFAVSVAGLGPATSRQHFEVMVPLAVESFAPDRGPAGTVVTIRGRGFSSRAADNQVTLSGRAAVLVSHTPTELQVRIPDTRSGTFTVAVRGNAQARTQAGFMVTRPPRITGFEPATGEPGTEVTVTGAGFGTTEALVEARMGNRVLEMLSLSNTQVVVRLPDDATSAPIAIAVRLMGTGTTAAPFRVLPPLRATAITPATGPVGTQVVIAGEGFARGTSVRFAGDRRARIRRTSATELRLTVPRRAETGDVRVRHRDGREVTIPGGFTIAAPE